MSAMTNYMETKMLNAMRGTAEAAPVSVWVGMFLSNPGESGTGGTEVSYEGYVRQQLQLTAPTASGNTVGCTNSEALVFPTPPGSSGTVTHVAVFDAQTGGNMLCYAALNNNIVLTSETSPRIQSGNVQLSLSAGNMDASYKMRVLNWLRGTTISGFTSYLALYNGDPASGGTELTGTGYARMAVTFAEPAEQVSGQMTMQNNAAMESAAANVNWGTWAYGVILDAATGGNRVWTAKNAGEYAMQNGAKAYFDAGTIQVALN